MLNIFSYQVLTKLQSLIQRRYSISQLSATWDTFSVRFLNNASFTNFDKLASVEGKKILHATDIAETII